MEDPEGRQSLERGSTIPKKPVSTGPRVERVFLVGVDLKGRASMWTADESLKELGDLARSAGARVAGSMVQRQKRPTNTYLGAGKIEELSHLGKEGRVNTIICDDELTPTQQRNLENALDGFKVIDRTALILDVFGRRAHTREGRLQVELAQHEYLLPRLAGQWSHLERLGGGIGTRGPGETQIETDRRLARNRIAKLKKSLKDVRRHREQYRERRKEQRVPVASLVGYTNSGKSTLFNALTGAGVAAEDRLFSTLDPITRKIVPVSGREFLLTDTVGFIHKLPPTVVAAFGATLEEVGESELIIHVVDITHPNLPQQVDVVDQTLDELGLSHKPRIVALNKTDLLEPIADVATPTLEAAAGGRPAVFISALCGTGLDQLMTEVDRALSETFAYPMVAAHD